MEHGERSQAIDDCWKLDLLESVPTHSHSSRTGVGDADLGIDLILGHQSIGAGDDRCCKSIDKKETTHFNFLMSENEWNNECEW